MKAVNRIWGQALRILFYLPVVTPWWFSQIITPMLRTLHDEAELHIMIAPIWRNTGLEPDHLLPLANLDRIHWHIMDHEDPAPFRLNGAAVPGLLDLVNTINPDLTLARSADEATPALFPGAVRYIMEGAAPPFDTDKRWVILEERLFSFGAMPRRAAAIGQECARILGPAWAHAEQLLGIEPPLGWRNQWGLPHDRPILGVPLQYEHEEDFFVAGSAAPRARDLLAMLLETLDEQVFLAITDHPLNRVFLDRSDVHQLIAAHPHRARLCTSNALPQGATGVFAAHADALLIDQSKSWSLAAFAGTPALRIGTRPIADWIGFSEDLASFPRKLKRPDRVTMRRWFGWHLGARVLDPTRFTLDELIARANGKATGAMITANLQMVLDRLPRAEAA